MIEARRNTSIDIAKGIGIVFVVLGHLIGKTGDEPLLLTYVKGFVYQFHIPLFFFLSGLLFKPDEAWIPFLKKKIKRLYIPFVIANLIFLGVDILLRTICGHTIIPIDETKHAIKIILQLSITPMGGATWFLIALFRTVIIYKILQRLFKQVNVIVPIICLAIAYIGTMVKIGYNVGPTMVALFFYCLGDFAKPLEEEFEKAGTKVKILLFATSFLVLALLRPYNQMDVSAGSYQNVFHALIGSLSGIILVLTASSLISRTLPARNLSNLGTHTMAILIGHFASFIIITLIQMAATNAPRNAILSHPCFDISGIWSFLYLIAGISLPLCAIRTWAHIAQICRNNSN
ncbi:MAG: acyltransferase family protein [Bacteroidales bacterium]|nr:acyltransferase family protein [Bacteroidales bacterium]